METKILNGHNQLENENSPKSRIMRFSRKVKRMLGPKNFCNSIGCVLRWLRSWLTLTGVTKKVRKFLGLAQRWLFMEFPIQ